MHKSFLILFSTIFSLLLHIIVCYVFVHHLDLGVKGVSLATSITFFFQFFLATIFSLLNKDLEESYTFPTKENLNGIWKYMKKGISATVLILFDWWALELMIFYAIFISIEATAA